MFSFSAFSLLCAGIVARTFPACDITIQLPAEVYTKKISLGNMNHELEQILYVVVYLLTKNIFIFYVHCMLLVIVFFIHLFFTYLQVLCLC